LCNLKGRVIADVRILSGDDAVLLISRVDLQEKILPYLRPLYDALHDLLEPDELQKLMDKNIIEIAPLAYMRGRTLSGSFVILDEAQNTRKEAAKGLVEAVKALKAAIKELLDELKKSPLAKLDKDGDGVISVAEVKEVVKEQAQKLGCAPSCTIS
jgi:predicted ribonuclease YlaK